MRMNSAWRNVHTIQARQPLAFNFPIIQFFFWMPKAHAHNKISHSNVSSPSLHCILA